MSGILLQANRISHLKERAFRAGESMNCLDLTKKYAFQCWTFKSLKETNLLLFLFNIFCSRYPVLHMHASRSSFCEWNYECKLLLLLMMMLLSARISSYSSSKVDDSLDDEHWSSNILIWIGDLATAGPLSSTFPFPSKDPKIYMVTLWIRKREDRCRRKIFVVIFFLQAKKAIGRDCSSTEQT